MCPAAGTRLSVGAFPERGRPPLGRGGQREGDALGMLRAPPPMVMLRSIAGTYVPCSWGPPESAPRLWGSCPSGEHWGLGGTPRVPFRPSPSWGSSAESPGAAGQQLPLPSSAGAQATTRTGCCSLINNTDMCVFK